MKILVCIFVACMALTILVDPSTISGSETPPTPTAPLGQRLRDALDQADFAWRRPDGRLLVWVYFQDRGLTPAALADALQTAEAALSERAARRRAKVTPVGQSLVKAGDLPLNSSYLAQIIATGAELRRQSRYLNAASFLATNAQISRIAAVPQVSKIDLVGLRRPRDLPQPVAPIADQKTAPEKAAAWTIDYGPNLAAMEQANVPPVHELGINGAGVLIGILDTGFHTTHECLAMIPVLATYDFINDDDYVDNEGLDPDSQRNHGTMVMSTVMGNTPGQLVAPAFGAAAVLAKTEDMTQEVPAEEDQWVAGLEWAEALGADIINSSLGYLDWYEFSDLDGNTAVTTIAADQAVARGVIVVNSAGNEGDTTDLLIAPADADSVITVGAVDALDLVTSFSSSGPTFDGRIKPDVVALGYMNRVANPWDDFGYIPASGTSFSSPLTAAVAALVLSRAPSLTPMEVREALRETADNAQTPDNDYGWGLIDAYAAVTYYGPSFSHEPLADQIDQGPYSVTAVITDRVGVAPQTVTLHYRLEIPTSLPVVQPAWTDWQQVAMQPSGNPDEYTAAIPDGVTGTIVEYTLEATSTNGVTSYLPGLVSPAAGFTFTMTGLAAAPGDGQLPQVTRLAPNVPNPFNPSTTLAFELAAGGQVKIAVFDLRGSLVKSLLAESLPAGTHRVRWDGTDSAGRVVGSGTYLCRLETGTVVQERKLQLVR